MNSDFLVLPDGRMLNMNFIVSLRLFSEGEGNLPKLWLWSIIFEKSTGEVVKVPFKTMISCKECYEALKKNYGKMILVGD